MRPDEQPEPPLPCRKARELWVASDGRAQQIGAPAKFGGTEADWAFATLHWKTCAACASVIAEFQQLDDLIERTGPRFATASFLDSAVAAMVDARNDSDFQSPDFQLSQKASGPPVRLIRGLSESQVLQVPMPPSIRRTLINRASGSSVVSQIARRTLTPTVVVFTTAAAVAIAGIVLFVTPGPLPPLSDVHGGASSHVIYKSAGSDAQVLGGERMMSTGGVAGVELPLAPTDRAAANARTLASIRR